MGKQIADSVGIERNLFFTALEQAHPLYLHFLAALGCALEKNEIDANAARSAVLPYIANGLDTLEARFGKQPQIDSARVAISPYLKDMTQVSA
ncbi:MAG: hypothetical protein HYS18_07355 [Burkholderiales bacterium]|nr:hypothetical protein [Burkholderiales bacterium]